jgi:heme exporter protein B
MATAPSSSVSAAAPATAGVSLLRAASAILGKELRTELRTRELVTTTVVFVLMVVVMFSFSFDPTSEESRHLVPGLLWIAFLFAGSLMLQPSFVREQTNETLAALRLAPIDPFAILLGKLLANFLFLALAEVLLLPVFAVFYNLSLVPVLPQLLLVLALGTLGVVTAGTLFSAVAAQARMRELLLPLLLLPVLTPVLIASRETTAGLFDDPPELSATGIALLVACDIIFLTVSWLLFEYLLEE